ncbi:hypothetical protein [Actinotalea solisilvae]|uniref:hypothetical protein n=1 Tax=Actinotalea solisilvae TaxID=2072922 RepID=UPI0018F211E1|nr:hypothetical protein [Actinotalea solisilvae]
MIPPRWTWPALAAVAAGLLVRLLGLRLVDALLVALVTLVVALVWAALPAGEEDPWPPDRRDDAAGARSEIAVLTWAFIGRDGRVTEAAVRRLRELAAQRLARLGLPVAAGLGPRPASAAPDPERDRARAVLGERAWAALTAPGGHMPSLADVAHCVDVIERLDPSRPLTGGPRS